MGRTYRRHSYRRSKRWNPSRYQSEEQATAPTRIIRRGHRNPGGFTRYLGDGSRVSVDTDDGQVTVSDRGGVFSTYRIGRGRLHQFLKELMRTPANRLDKYDFQGERLREEGSYSVQLNPRRGKKSRRYRKAPSFRRARGGKYSRIRHGRRHGKRSRAHRNPKIRRSEAKAMKRVLKRHGFNPRRGRRSRRSRR